MHGRLPRRVAATDHHDVLAGHLAGCAGGRAVVDAGADKIFDATHAESAIGHTRSDHDGAGADLGVIHPDVVMVGTHLDAGGATTAEELGPEPARLDAGTLGQSHTGDAPGEAEIVLDHRAGSGLTTDRAGFEHCGGQTFGCAVHGSGKPGRPCTQHHDV